MGRSVFHTWVDGLEPVRTSALEKEIRINPGHACEYTLPMVGDRVRGKADGTWFGTGVLTYVDGADCEVAVDRPLLGIVGQEPFTAQTTLADVWLLKRRMPPFPVMWKLAQPAHEWAASLEGRWAARFCDLRVIMSARHGLLLGVDKIPASENELMFKYLVSYFDAMSNVLPDCGWELCRPEDAAANRLPLSSR